jgi:pimeloyl-ACP methyl ester carboxylesterase
MILDRVEAAYKNAVCARVDETKAIRYFSNEDFPGLEKKALAIHSSKGHRLQGYFYQYPNPKPKKMIVFDHGMGSGHRGYMKEIELLAKRGYLVFAYDHTGCMDSGGEETGGFSQSLMDLDDVLTALKKKEAYKDFDISVVGHSWGGFAALNISKLHPDVSHIVAIAGYISVESIMKQRLGIFHKKIYQREKAQHPNYLRLKDYMRAHAVRTLRRSKARVLVIHSSNDRVVSFQRHFCVMREALAGYSNISFMEVAGKGHNPNYTRSAVRYKAKFFRAYRRALRRNLFETERDEELFADRFDWDFMTEQDMEVWAKIFETLEA